MSNPVLVAAIQRRERSLSEMERMIQAAEARGSGSFTDPDARAFEKLAKSIKKDDATIEQLQIEDQQSEKAASAAADLMGGSGRRGAFHTGGGETYGPDLTHSFFRDLATISAAQIGWTGQGSPDAARERLQQHRKEVEIEARSNPDLDRRLVEMRLTPQSLREQRVNPNTTNGSGGEFVPPLWLVGQYVPFARSGRVIANRMRRSPLPPGTDSINLPKMSTGTATAVQSAQNTPRCSRRTSRPQL
jgi:hypothetical protein